MPLNIYTIAIAMLTETETFTYEIISNKVKLSNKTVRNNMPEIISLFHNYKIKIQKNPGIGIRLHGTKEDILKCYHFCETEVTKSTRVSSEIRQNIIAFLLLTSFHKVTISMLERKLYITRPSIYDDLKHIKQFFSKYNITISKNRKTGLCILSGEKRIRHCLLDLTCSMLNHDISVYSLSPEVYQYLSDRTQVSIIQKIRNFILKTAKETHTKITESDLQRAVLFVQIAVFRMQAHQFTSLNAGTAQKIKNSEVRHYLEEHLKTLIRHFHVELSDEEMIYLIAQLSVYLCSTDEYIYRESSNPILLLEIIHQFTNHINSIVKIKNTKQFEKELFPFLEKTMQKFNFEYDCYNPSTDLIIHKFPKLFSIAGSINIFTENTLQATLPKDAIATITLLLASVQEIQSDTIVCGFWSQAHSFKKKLFLNILHTSAFHMKIIELQDEVELQNFHGDFILSTVDHVPSDIEVISIPELMNPEFIHLLNEKIQDIRQEKRNGFFR